MTSQRYIPNCTRAPRDCPAPIPFSGWSRSAGGKPIGRENSCRIGCLAPTTALCSPPTWRLCQISAHPARLCALSVWRWGKFVMRSFLVLRIETRNGGNRVGDECTMRRCGKSEWRLYVRCWPKTSHSPNSEATLLVLAPIWWRTCSHTSRQFMKESIWTFFWLWERVLVGRMIDRVKPMRKEDGIRARRRCEIEKRRWRCDGRWQNAGKFKITVLRRWVGVRRTPARICDLDFNLEGVPSDGAWGTCAAFLIRKPPSIVWSSSPSASCMRKVSVVERSQSSSWERSNDRRRENGERRKRKGERSTYVDLMGEVHVDAHERRKLLKGIGVSGTNGFMGWDILDAWLIVAAVDCISLI